MIDFFKKKYKINPNTQCWEWILTKNNQGYGRIWFDKKLWLVHRLSYFLHIGDFDNKLYVCHRCDNPSCINPKHLFLGTAKDNSQDMLKKGRISKKCTAKDHTHTSSKLTKKQVKYIRCSEETNYEMAMKFGVSPNTIGACRRRKTYRDLP